MRLLAVVLNYRTAEMSLEAATAALEALEEVPDWALEIVDNDSQDGSFGRLTKEARERGWPEQVRVVQTDHNGGFGYGNNYAIRRALEGDDPPEYVYLLNSDAFPARDAIHRLLDFMDAHPRAGIAGSYIHGTDGEPHLTAFRFPSLKSELARGARLGLLKRLLGECEVQVRPLPSETTQVDWLAGASMMLRTEMLEEVGLFDETFFLYFEETDLCLRAARRGWETWYVPESRVAHVGSVSTGIQRKNQRMPTFWFDSRWHYFRKNHGKGYLRLANAAHAAGLLSFQLRKHLLRKEDTDPERYLKDFLAYNFSPQQSHPGEDG